MRKKIEYFYCMVGQIGTSYRAIMSRNFQRGGLRSVSVSHKSDFGDQEIRQLEL